MTTPEERRQEHLDAIAEAENGYRWGDVDPEAAYDRLLAYLEENEPKLALAFKFGIPDSVPEEVIRHGLTPANFCADEDLFVDQPGVDEDICLSQDHEVHRFWRCANLDYFIENLTE